MLSHLIRRFWGKIALWSLLWLVFIGGIGAIFNLAEIRDDHRRADLAQRGVRTTGIISSGSRRSELKGVRRCTGKGWNAIVQFTPANKKRRRICVQEGLPAEYTSYVSSRPMPDARIGITYDPKDPSRFFVTSLNGDVPRRDLRGNWGRWLKQTVILFAIYSLGTAFFLWRSRRPSNGASAG